MPPPIYLQALTTALATTLTAVHNTSLEETVRATLRDAGAPITDHPKPGV